MSAQPQSRPPEVVLRTFEAEDDEVLRALFEDPETRDWNPDPSAADLPEWRERHNVGGEDFATWAISEPGGRLLGTISVFDVDRTHASAEIGYRVAPGERGRGVGTAALDLASRRVFSELGLNRVQLFHAVDNPASCRVAERAGFALEGTLRQSYRYGDGRLHDEHLHARLAGDH